MKSKTPQRNRKQKEQNENYRTAKTITKIRALYGLNRRMNVTNERTNELKDRTIEIIQYEQKRKIVDKFKK